MNDMHTVAFPGLGLEFEINSVAFTLAGIEVKWYGILITIGICLALFMFYRYAKNKEGLPEDHLYNLALITVPVSIVGARVMYVVTEWDRYRGDFLKMINIREGGLAIYGAIIFGIITVYTYSRITKLSTLKLMDAAAPAVMIGQAIGRWGNFMNAEAYGYSPGVETLPWRMEITDSLGRVTVAHPTFLYESLWNFVGILLIYLIFYKKKKFDGQILFTHHVTKCGTALCKLQQLRGKHLIAFSVISSVSVIRHVDRTRYGKGKQFSVGLGISVLNVERAELHAEGLSPLRKRGCDQSLDPLCTWCLYHTGKQRPFMS